jgi:hypothetical protein
VAAVVEPEAVVVEVEEVVEAVVVVEVEVGEVVHLHSYHENHQKK